jgi:hypothetical protein
MAWTNEKKLDFLFITAGVIKGPWMGAGVCIFEGYHISKVVLVSAVAYLSLFLGSIAS